MDLFIWWLHNTWHDNNNELAEQISEHIFQLDSSKITHYALLLSICVVVGRCDDIENLQKNDENLNTEKDTKCNWIEVNKKVHAVVAGHMLHPHMQDIYTPSYPHMEMKAIGYVLI